MLKQGVMSQKYFGTDGIRGRSNDALMTSEMALHVAKATVVALREKHNGGATQRAIIGKDTRLSGYMFEQAMTAGFVAMGMNVIQVGPIPTPGIAMLTRSMRADVGVMISASHNKFEDNGIKLFGPDGYKLDDKIEAQIEALMVDPLTKRVASPDKIGKARRLDDALGRYVEHVKRSFPKGENLEGLKVVVDCAHGAAYKVAPQILWELEAEVVSIGVHPNGRNINDGYGATAMENLQQAVIAEKADIGIALDGDADRLIVVDELGDVVDGDQIMAALALDMKARGRLAQDTVVATVMSNLGFEDKLKREGIDLVRTQVGDRYVMEEMRKAGYNLGGEQSGHIVMSNYGTTGDGLLSGLRVLNLVKNSGKTASQALQVFTPYPQILKNVKAAAEVLDDTDVQAAIEKVKADLHGQGRVLVRASGTEPVVRVMVEGQDENEIQARADELCAVIGNKKG